MTCSQTQIVLSHFASRRAGQKCLERMIVVEADLAPEVRGILALSQAERHSLLYPWSYGLRNLVQIGGHPGQWDRYSELGASFLARLRASTSILN